MVLEKVRDVGSVPREPGGMKSDRLHGLGDVSLAAWQGMLGEEVLNLRFKILRSYKNRAER